MEIYKINRIRTLGEGFLSLLFNFNKQTGEREFFYKGVFGIKIIMVMLVVFFSFSYVNCVVS